MHKYPNINKESINVRLLYLSICTDIINKLPRV